MAKVSQCDLNRDSPFFDVVVTAFNTSNVLLCRQNVQLVKQYESLNKVCLDHWMQPQNHLSYSIMRYSHHDLYPLYGQIIVYL